MRAECNGNPARRIAQDGRSSRRREEVAQTVANPTDVDRELRATMPEMRSAVAASPAYDLTYARGAGYTKSHQMSLNGKRDDFTRDDLLALGRKMGIKRGRDIVGEVVTAMSNWSRYAKEAGVSTDKIRSIQQQFRLL